MRPEVFLDVAKQWGKDKADCEAHERSAVSRAYYASFHSCREVIEELGLSVPDHSASHQRVINALRDSGDRKLKALSNKLKDLKGMREKADYDIEYRLPKHTLTVAIRKAEIILQDCQEKSEEGVRSVK